MQSCRSSSLCWNPGTSHIDLTFGIRHFIFSGMCKVLLCVLSLPFLCQRGIVVAGPLLYWTHKALGRTKLSGLGRCIVVVDIYARIRAAWSCFGKNKEILQDKQLPISLKKQVMDQCILPTMTYGCQTWSLNKQMTNKLRTAQRAMERKMLDLKLKDKIPCAEIRKRTKIIDII